MSSTQDKATGVNPNADVIAGLREAADWFEAHPELPPFHAFIAHYAYGQDARGPLTTVAAVLGERATERADHERVHIEGSFGREVRVSADALVSALGGVPPAKPVYDSIIKPEYSVRIGAPAAGARQ